MKTTELTRKQIQVNELTEFANELKANQFTVLVSAKHPFEWLYFYKDGDFGNVNPDYFGAFNFGTVHKPCRECGTGFGTDRETNLTIESANNSLIFAPNWASSSDIKAIRKYKSIDEFITSTHNKWAEYYIL
jgi:hypothetical protein